MKSFLKKRWHSIPVALVSVLLVLALVAGGAFAAFTVLTGTTEVTVEEAITAEYSISGVWTPIPDEFVMEVDPYFPGEEDTGYYRVYNESSVELPIAVDLTAVPDDWVITGINIAWSDSGWETWQGLVTVPAEGYAEFTLTLAVPTDVAPGIYYIGFALARQ